MVLCHAKASYQYYYVDLLAAWLNEGLEQRGLRSRLAPWEHLDPGKAGKTARPREGMLHAAKAHD